MDYNEIAKVTAARIKKMQAQTPADELVCHVRHISERKRFILETALAGEELCAIGSIRRASPDKGVVASKAGFSHIKYGIAYQKCGVQAVMISTEPYFYRGEDVFLTDLKGIINLPLIQNDFFISPYQIYHAKRLGAHSITLLSTVMTTEKLKEFIFIAKSLNISPFVVAHSVKSVLSAVEAGASIICVDNLNPKTGKIDYSIGISLRRFVPENIIYVVNNIKETSEYINELKRINVNAVVLGDGFMRCRGKEKRLAQLLTT